MMESSKSTENLTTMENNNNNKINLVLIVIALVVAVLALIVACVGISLKGITNIMVPDNTGSASGLTGGGSGTSTYGDDKIWSIAIGHGNYNEAYIDEETGTLKGFIIDLTNAVCKTANKNCRIVYDIWTRCWDSEEGQVPRGGLGLMSDWYDGCAGWYGTYERYRTFVFSVPFGRADEESLFVKRGSPLKSSWKDQTNKKIGILDGWWTDEFCLNRNADKFTEGAPFTIDQIVHYVGPPDLVEAVNNGEVDYAFLSATSFVAQELERVEGDPILPCSVHGPSVMTRQINQEFLNWWDEAQKRLMATSEYKTICQDLKEEHGDQPGQSAEQYCFL